MIEPSHSQYGTLLSAQEPPPPRETATIVLAHIPVGGAGGQGTLQGTVKVARWSGQRSGRSEG